MLRALSRMIGYLLLAGAFITAVVDGTRSIAASSVVFTSLQGFVDRVAPSAVINLRGFLLQAHALLWDPVATTLLRSPLAAALLVLGVLFVATAAGGREPAVGYPSRS
jgi:hypothetical protein